ncbi:MAG: LacI family DNA-binding transcriptional regulator [Armatimonadetes bacterium]|nr:LacI family DNA-binding transcriptional regulator [Armatimonadota bacterium]
MARQRGVTLKQIAERAGCSVTAVSKTLNGARGTAAVSEETQKRVWAIAQEMGYTPNYMARALQSGRSNCIGLVSRAELKRDHGSQYWSRIFSGVQTQLRGANQDLIVVGPDRSQDELQRGIAHLLQRRLDALIVPLVMYAEYIPELEAVDAPIVYCDSSFVGNHPCVAADMAPGLRSAMTHLAELGHRRIVWVPLTENGAVNDLPRSEGVMAQSRALGLEVTTWPVAVDNLASQADVAPAIEAAREQIARRLANGLPGTALVVYSERAALGACAALRAAGLRIPEDVSVLSFDDFYAEYAVPPLTVVTGNLWQVGERSATMALALAEGQLTPEQASGLVERPASELIVRASTGPAPKR